MGIWRVAELQAREVDILGKQELRDLRFDVLCELDIAIYYFHVTFIQDGEVKNSRDHLPLVLYKQRKFVGSFVKMIRQSRRLQKRFAKIPSRHFSLLLMLT